jgi:HD-GYP domain-containing protein (c-di-GMP phosphodiesterase class II)
MSEARERYLKTYIAALVAFAVALCASWAYSDAPEIEPQLVVGAVVLGCLMLLGDMFSIQITEHTAANACAIALMVAVAALGPMWAALAVIPYALYVGRGSVLRSLYELGHSVTIVYLAGIVFSFASAPLLLDKSTSWAVIFYGTLVSGVTLLGTSEMINVALLKVKYGQPLRESWREITQPYLLSSGVSVVTAGLGVLALKEYGAVAAVVVVMGSIASQTLVHRSREQVEENRKLQARVGSLEEALATSNTTFGTMIIQDLGRKDGYTHRHAAATAVYAADLAREMKLGEARAGRLRMAGLLHNVGLFGMPEELLLASGKLNSIAQSQLAEHPARGEEALSAIPEFEEMASWVRWHHERPDGRGYPDKLRAPWIPIEAKILAVAQSYAEMVLDQPSRPGMSLPEAREKLTSGIDTEFDGVVVRAFLRILDTESEGYRMADDHRFAFPTPDARGRAVREASAHGPGDDQAQKLPR